MFINSDNVARRVVTVRLFLGGSTGLDSLNLSGYLEFAGKDRNFLKQVPSYGLRLILGICPVSIGGERSFL